MKNLFSTTLLILLALTMNNLFAQSSDTVVIELVQTTGKFETTSLNLKPGLYQFKVKNDGVDKDLGFVIQKEEDKDKDVMRTAVPNSFTTNYIKKGKTESTGVVELKEGNYVFSCPLNPTPQYQIIVK